MPQTEVTEECRCGCPDPMNANSHNAGCPVLNHFKTDGTLKKDRVLTITQRDSRSD